MQVNLAPRTWAVSTADGVHVGVLDGDVDEGWETTTVLLSQRVLPAVIRRLNLGGLWTDGVSAVAVADGCARLDFEGRTVSLGVEGAARLQILAHLTRHGAAEVPAFPRLLVDVQAAPARMVTEELHIIGDIAADATVSAVPNGLILHLQTTTGPIDIQLPALASLVAAIEGRRDGIPVIVTVQRVGRDPQSLTLPADEVLQAAADAQWLLPSLIRSVDSQA